MNQQQLDDRIREAGLEEAVRKADVALAIALRGSDYDDEQVALARVALRDAQRALDDFRHRFTITDPDGYHG